MNERETIERMLDLGNNLKMKRRVLAYIGDNPKRLDALMYFFFHSDQKYHQRAAYPVGFIGEKHPHLMVKYLDKILKQLEQAKHNAVARNTFRILHYMDIPEEFEGKIFDSSMSHFLDLKNAIGIRVFAMNVMANIALNHKDLIPEVISLIEEYYEHSSAGYKSRANRLLKRLNKALN